MTFSEQAAAVGVAAALLLPAIPGLWRAASMRGDLFQKWKDRVDLAYNGLSEQAAAELIRIQEITTRLVVSAGEPFDPIRIVQDPSELRDPMMHFLRLLRIRGQLRNRLRSLLFIGPILLVVLPLYALGIVTGALYVAHLVMIKMLFTIGLAATGSALVLLLFLLVAYALLQHRLSSAEILATEASSKEHDNDS